MEKKIIILKDYLMGKDGTLQLINNGRDSLGNIKRISVENETNDSTSFSVEKLSENELGNEENIDFETLNVNSEKEKFKWNHENTLLFLDAYEKKLTQFRDPKVKKKNLWLSIAEEMGIYGYNIDGDSLDKKMRNMRSTYSKILDNNKTKSKTGKGRINWEYFSHFEQIFAKDKCLNPTNFVGSMILRTDDKNKLETTPQTPKDILKPLCLDIGGHQTPSCSSPSPSSSASTAANKHRWKRLDVFRKRQLDIEQEKVYEIKKVREQLEESNRIQREKIILLDKYLNKNNK